MSTATYDEPDTYYFPLAGAGVTTPLSIQLWGAPGSAVISDFATSAGGSGYALLSIPDLYDATSLTITIGDRGEITSITFTDGVHQDEGVGIGSSAVTAEEQGQAGAGGTVLYDDLDCVEVTYKGGDGTYGGDTENPATSYSAGGGGGAGTAGPGGDADGNGGGEAGDGEGGVAGGDGVYGFAGVSSVWGNPGEAGGHAKAILSWQDSSIAHGALRAAMTPNIKRKRRN